MSSGPNIEFKYRPDVDGLRAIAIVLVLLYHGDFGFSGGYIGVDVFFVISGFLITGLILKQHQSGTFRLSDFWLRRIRRILPASTLVVGATFITGWFLLLPLAYDELAKSTIAQQLMFSNIYFWKNTSYFAGSSEIKPLLHTWSLAVEEQFYLLYPSLLVLLCRIPKQLQFAILTTLCFGSFCLSQWGVNHYPSATFYLLPTRAWELLLGGLLCFARVPVWMTKIHANLLGGIGLGAILYAGWVFDSNTLFPGFAALLPCLGTAAIIYSHSHHQTWIGMRLGIRPVVFVGLLSYSLYLWHWPILAFAKYWQGQSLPLSMRLIALTTTGILAYLSWRYVELPFRKTVVLNKPRQAFAAAIVSIVVLVSFSVIVSNQQGVRSRFHARVLAFEAARDSHLFLNSVELQTAVSGHWPTFGFNNGQERIMVWGDSHAMALIPALDTICRELGVQGIQATHSATAPLLGFASKGKWSLGNKSTQFNDLVFAKIEKGSIDIVVLAAAWSSYSDDFSFRECVDQTVNRLVDLGVKVVIVRDVARHKYDVPRRLALASLTGQATSEIGVSIKEHREANRLCDNVFSNLKSLDVLLLDPAEYFVDESGIWRAEYNDVSMYRDRGHLSIEGALRLIPMFDGVRSSIESTSSKLIHTN